MKKSLLTVLAIAASTPCFADLPVLAEVPVFELQSARGGKFGKKELLGHNWVVDFMFTSCGGQCPLLSKKMEELQKAFAGMPEVRFVSITVDPTTDTPAVLSRYAKRFHAGPQWAFLTGKKKAIDTLMLEGFHLGGGGDSIAHSFRFVLVDKKGQIRGYYAVLESAPLEKLKSDLQELMAQ